MLRSKDLNEEIDVLEKKVKEGKVSDADVLKALCLLLKVLRDVKTNQVTAMKKEFGDDVLIKPQKRKEGKK